MPKKFADNKDLVLVELYRLVRVSDGQIYYSAAEIEPHCPANVSKAFVEIILRSHLKALNVEEAKVDGEVVYALTDKGITRAETVIETQGTWHEFENIETSVGEVVALPDDDEALVAIREDLAKIEEHLGNANDVGAMTAEQVQSAKTEMNALRTMFDGTMIRAGVAATHARQTLNWIADKAGSAAVGELAKKVVQAILSFLGYGS